MLNSIFLKSSLFFLLKKPDIPIRNAKTYVIFKKQFKSHEEKVQRCISLSVSRPQLLGFWGPKKWLWNCDCAKPWGVDEVWDGKNKTSCFLGRREIWAQELKAGEVGIAQSKILEEIIKQSVCEKKENEIAITRSQS